MKRILALLILLTPRLCAEGPVPPPLTLTEAVQRSLDNNREALASKKSVESAQKTLAASYGKFLPHVGVEGRWTRINSAIDIDLNPIRTALIGSNLATLQAAGITNPLVIAGLQRNLQASLPAFVEPVQKESFYALSGTLTQPLFTGGKLLANTRAKKEELNTAGDQDRQTRNRVVVEAVTAYCRCQLAREVADIRRETVDGIRQHEQNAAQLLAQGLISRAGKMRTEVALAEAEREYAKSLRDQELAMILFGNALGEPQASYTLTTPLPLPPAVKPLERYVETGLANNPDLSVLTHTEGMLHQKINATRAEFMPTVALFGKYEFYRHDLTLLDPEWAVGFAAQLNVFNGGSDLNDLKAARSRVEAIRYYEQFARDQVATGVRKYYHDLETAREQYESLGKSRELAEENLRLNTLSFKEGAATALDVIDAQLALAKVKAEQSKALYDASVALVNLLSVSGNAREITNYQY